MLPQALSVTDANKPRIQPIVGIKKEPVVEPLLLGVHKKLIGKKIPSKYACTIQSGRAVVQTVGVVIVGAANAGMQLIRDAESQHRGDIQKGDGAKLKPEVPSKKNLFLPGTGIRRLFFFLLYEVTCEHISFYLRLQHLTNKY